jgi:hypothetical protein
MAYGLRPLDGAIGGRKPVEFPAADGYTGNIFTGDFVERLVDGTIQRQETTTGLSPVAANPTVGVGIGYRWVDGAGQSQWGSYYPGGSANTEVFAMVIDDPTAEFMIQSDGDTTFADVGDNATVAGFDAASGSTQSGLSGIYLSHATVAQTALTLRIVKVPEDGHNETLTSDKNVIVRILPAVHQDVLSDQIP